MRNGSWAEAPTCAGLAAAAFLALAAISQACGGRGSDQAEVVSGVEAKPHSPASAQGPGAQASTARPAVLAQVHGRAPQGSGAANQARGRDTSSPADAHQLRGSAGPSWYDPTPLLASLRPDLRGSPGALAAMAGVGALQDLPLYELEVDLQAEQSSYLLRQRLWFTNTSQTPLREVVLRIYANAIGSSRSGRGVPVRFVRGQCLDQRQCRFVRDGSSTIRVEPSKDLAPQGRMRIELELAGSLQRIDSSRTNLMAQGLEGMATMLSGHGSGDYGLLAMGDGIASLANFYAVVARRHRGQWMGAERRTFGDLGSDDMGHVRATVVADPDMQVVTSGLPVTRPRLRSDNRREHTVVAAMVRDFAIMASAEFASAVRRVGGIEVRSHYLRQERAAGNRVLEAAAASLAAFERRFGPYPYADLDVVEAPLVGGAGGVEFAGLVTVASMLYRPPGSGGGLLSGLLGAAGPNAPMQEMTDAMLEFVTAHEVAHQYWHGLVGSDSRIHPFNDEGLAQYSALLYLEDRYGRVRAELEARRQVAMGYKMMRLMGQPDGPVDLPVSAFETALSYGGLVYGKGPLVFRELRNAVGDRLFFDALREYVRKYRFGLAPRRAFIEMLAQRHPRARSIARRWLDERHGDEDLGRANMAELMTAFAGQGHGASAGQSWNALGSGQGMPGPSGAQGDGTSNLPDAEQLLKALQELTGSANGDNGSGAQEGQLDKLLELFSGG